MAVGARGPWERDPPDTATGADGIPVFDDVSFRTLDVTARGGRRTHGLHGDGAVLYDVVVVTGGDWRTLVVVDVLGDNGFQVYTAKTCVDGLRGHT